MSKGVLYLASGSSYLSQARTSAKSLKRHNPDLPTTLYTDEDVEEGVFDQVIILDESIEDPGDSILTERHFPYDRNLYLDSDTYICGDISELFDILNICNMAISHNNARHWWTKEVYDQNDVNIPDSFPEYSSGVISYNDCPEVLEFFQSWRKQYESFGFRFNQPAMRLALYNNCNINFNTLTPEYNFVNKNVAFAAGEIKILHHQGCSEEELVKFESLLNEHVGMRVTTFDTIPLRVVPDRKSFRYKLEDLTLEDVLSFAKNANEKRKCDGVIETVKAGMRIFS